MNKTVLLGQLEHTKNNFVLTCASVALFGDERSYSILKEKKVKFGKYYLKLFKVVDKMKIEKDRINSCDEFLKVRLKSLVKKIITINLIITI